jgi:hypothetical protein
MLRAATLAIFASVLCQAATAAQFVLCEAPDREDIIVELDSVAFEGRSLTCIKGGNGFYTDMTPCAPDGGYGLSAPSGSAALVRVVDRWQEYGDHLGGVVAFSSSPSSYWFQGGFMSPSSGFSDQWSFEVSRLTGKAILSVLQEVEEDGARGYSADEYNCVAASQQF